ncbi:MAG: radical SAM protein [Candidatus Sumerlaeota bacterium]|nr:radical SAM protein [Candidatus Sumerlaeota bacterium]
MTRKSTFSVLLVRPSKYDDEGYVIRYWKGVLPSNTLGVLNTLAQREIESGRFGKDTRAQTVLLDDVVQDIDVKGLSKKYLGAKRRAVVCLVGVQSNQFPRATDLATRFKEAGFEVMIGGFHVSGSMALAKTTPPELKALMDGGITLVKGEVEDVFGDLLEDAYRGRLKLYYDIVERPDLENAPVPRVDGRYQRRFLFPQFTTIDTGRGCPFECSFCTIINVQGRKMRCRSADAIARQIEDNYRRHGVVHYFFTDDNFARNRNRDAILAALTELREKKNIPLSVMMQVDTKAWKIEGFCERAARAGCSQVFIGVESLNAANLEAADKRQNVIADYPEMVATWRRHGMASHGTLIIGFPGDTPESVARDVETLKGIGFEQCSFFMMTPLPGSADHAKMRDEGVWMAPDFNEYDSCHETLRLPNFEPGQWRKTYLAAWNSFFGFENMRDVLLRSNNHTYWGILKNFMWNCNSLREGIHPMIAGFWRLKPRADRRPGFAVEGRWAHFKRRTRESWQTLRAWKSLFLELEELWLQTRMRPAVEARMAEAAKYLASLRAQLSENAGQWSDAIGARTAGARKAMSESGANAREWLQVKANEISERMEEMARRLEGLRCVHDRMGEITVWVESLRRTLKRMGKIVNRLNTPEAVEHRSEKVAHRLESLRSALDRTAEMIHRLEGMYHDGVVNRFRIGYDYLQETRFKLSEGPLGGLTSRLLVRLNNRGRGKFLATRANLNEYWRRIREWLMRGRVFRLMAETPRLALTALKEIRLTLTFLIYFLKELNCD